MVDDNGTDSDVMDRATRAAVLIREIGELRVRWIRI
jgi:hypothetical protein